MDSFVSAGDRAAALEQSSFLTRVYGHLVLAVLLFVGLEIWFFTSGIADIVLRIFSGVSWLVVLGGFMLLSWVATLLAAPQVSRPAQYAGFALYVLLQALITVPLLAVADNAAPGVIATAAQVTIGGFLLLTAVVMLTGRDFSFLRTFLIWAGLFALGVIVCAVLFKFDLGTWFSAAMILLAGGSVLYTTSSILRGGYPRDADIGAAIQLFSGIALMFWYVLRIMAGSRR
jgi:FtsH-binding integral membrane protein